MGGVISLCVALLSFNVSAEEIRYWVRAKAPTVKERSQIADIGVSIESFKAGEIGGIATKAEVKALKKTNLLIDATELNTFHTQDFPSEDASYHNYAELTQALQQLATDNPSSAEVSSIGQSVQGRELWRIRITSDIHNQEGLPAIVFLGGHHAREHLSMEVPLLLAQHLLRELKNNNPEIKRLLSTREVHIIPVVNPDGSEFDISTGTYKYWRKNRASVGRNKFGVDLNRNYAFGWGGAGSSSSPDSDTYRGPSAFSEPETRAIKAFIESQSHLTTLLSFHTFSELILYPWGHTNGRMPDQRDWQLHKTMAETMAQWNNYEPMQSSELYLASGDTTDWSYGEHKIISFTFELDPKDMFSGGFYPGADITEQVFNKNLRACLFLLEYADNPYRVLEPNHLKYGLNSPLLE